MSGCAGSLCRAAAWAERSVQGHSGVETILSQQSGVRIIKEEPGDREMGMKALSCPQP